MRQEVPMSPRKPPASAYATLGVSPRDDFAKIRRVWLRRVRALYPRVLHGDDTAGATGELAALNDAYDALRWHRPARAEAAAPKPPRAAPRRPKRAPPQEAAPETVLGVAAPRSALDSFARARRAFAARPARTLGLA
jgi:curved DNA-binding protein CbpA